MGWALIVLLMGGVLATESIKINGCFTPISEDQTHKAEGGLSHVIPTDV